ncbi:hypothetical protein [Acetivibrio clariflavus]|uniref:hypothetical protein n=1 Tax=Acetivibrio clariflavus TaxID=288965 RepID=UPI00047FAA8F|nr:hypothetical protein [Acetivibrio clariflavus]
MDKLNVNMEILLDNDYATLWYYPDTKIIHHKFKKFIYGDKLINLLTTGAEYFEKKGCKKWLSDDRNSSALRKADLEWAEKNWKQKILDAGWKYWAIMMPDLQVGKMSLNPIINDFKELGVTVEIFDDVELAYKCVIVNKNSPKRGKNFPHFKKDKKNSM